MVACLGQGCVLSDSSTLPRRTSMSLALTADLRTEIANTRQCERDARIYQRLSALLWLNDGMTQDHVADHLGVTSRQVRKWVRLFREQGLEALCTLNYLGGQP